MGLSMKHDTERQYVTKRYTDGQITVNVEEFAPVIKHRINSYEDLFALLSVLEVYRYHARTCSLFIPCLLGQRSDRRFSDQSSFDLKVICTAINEYSDVFTRIGVLTPHSDVSLALLENAEALQPECLDRLVGQFDCIVSPDAGAYKKLYALSERHQVPLVAANKVRVNGAPQIEIQSTVPATCLIIDDYCDGGRTFVELAKELKSRGATHVALFVTHALFSHGVEQVLAAVDHVYCTDSIHPIHHPQVTQFTV